jgi:hypothetical protein
MEHLTRSSERKARWYCRKVLPRTLALVKATEWTDLLRVPPQSRCAKDQIDPSEDSNLSYEFVYSLPFEWLNSLSVSSPCGSNAQTPDNAAERSAIPHDILKRVLDTHGFVVVSGVLSETECAESLDLAWDWIEAASAAEHFVQCSVTGNSLKGTVDRNDASTHDSKSGYAFPRTVEGGLMPYYGSGHSSLAWKIRSHPSVRTVFASLYPYTLKESKALPLLSSLDGFVLWTLAGFM